MGRQPKAFRGQRKKERDHIGCGCFLCVGHDRSNKYVQKQKEADKEIIENDFIYSVSNCDCKCPVPYKDGNNVLACRKCHNEI